MIIQGTAIKGMTVSSSAAGITSDSYFNLVSLLLPGNGTNGAQNNTFLDSSASPLTVTRNGSVTQGAFSPFTFGSGTAQTNGYYSGYFDGSGDYLSSTLTASAPGTGSFTYECWFYISSLGSPVGIFNTRSGDSTDGFDVNVSTSNQLQITYTGSVLGSVSGIIANQWNHLAIVRNGSTNWTVYINGNVGTTISNSTNFTSTTMLVGAVALGGSSFNGYISNFRYVTSAVYTSSFTPTTSPLTAITGTKFLTCQSSQFIDNSTNAFAITVNGNSQPTVVNPFGMTDWSGYFDGSGDFLTVPNNTALNLSSGDFTIEGWFYCTALTADAQQILNKDGVFNASFPSYGAGINSSGVFVFSAGNGAGLSPTVTSYTGTAITLNTWNHFACVKSGTTIKVFQNGVQTVSTSQGIAITDGGKPLYIGYYNGGASDNYFRGQLSNIRIVKGTAVYTSNFTPPIAPLTAISGTSLLTCQSSTFIDNSTNAFTITVNGNAYTGTLNNPFGSIVNYTTPPLQAWSNYFDGTGDYLNLTQSAFAVGTGNFTLEAWVFLTSAPGTEAGVISSFNTATGQGFYLAVNSSRQPFFAIGNGGVVNPTVTGTAISLNTWVHLAAVRSSGTISLYVNGSSVGTPTSATASIDRTLLGIGLAYPNSPQLYITGYISNARINSNAVYTSNFTVPITPLTATANTSLLTCQSNRFVDNSINRFAITRNGDTSVQPFSPFNPDAAYSTSSIGASMYFDGASKLTTSASIDISGVFTIESWFNSTNTGGWFFTIGNFPVYIDVSAGTVTLDKSSVGNQLVTTANEQVKGSNCWKHLAITRDGSGLIRVFVNGVLLGSVSTSYSAGTLNGLGQYASYGGAWLGYACDFRVVVGTALYTSAFTPPTAPLTAVSGTAILLSGINAGIYDAAAKNVLETVGSAQISTVQSKWGGSSMLFDGSGDVIFIPSSNLLTMSTADFTVEAWINTGSQPGAFGTIFGAAASNGLVLTLRGAGTPSGIGLNPYGSGDIFNYSYTFTQGTWFHVAVTRSGTSLRVFINGTQLSSTVTNSTNWAAITRIGAIDSGGSQNFLGYINDLRITKGYARYTTNFTPPTSAFPTQ